MTWPSLDGSCFLPSAPLQPWKKPEVRAYGRAHVGRFFLRSEMKPRLRRRPAGVFSHEVMRQAELVPVISRKEPWLL